MLKISAELLCTLLYVRTVTAADGQHGEVKKGRVMPRPLTAQHIDHKGGLLDNLYTQISLSDSFKERRKRVVLYVIQRTR